MNNQKQAVLNFIRSGKILGVAGSKIYLDDKKINIADMPDFVELFQKSGEVAEGFKDFGDMFKKEEWNMEDMQEVMAAIYSAIETIRDANK